jgi:riboflavin kinase/FMN adenylyltransferase
LLNLGVDFVVVAKFDRELSQKSPQEFIRELIHRKLHAVGIVLGEEVIFGKNKCGNLQTLKNLAMSLAIQLEIISYEKYENNIISSSYIRRLIAEGDLQKASIFLGRPLCLRGTIVKGASRGKEIGFPTANLDTDRAIKPPCGVYGCNVILDGTRFGGVTNIGKRPTFGDAQDMVIEVHILDFACKDLCGRKMDVEFLFKIRDERKFSSIEQLKIQIANDIRIFMVKTGYGQKYI